MAAKGLADEPHDRGYLVFDGMDGKAHYVALNARDELAIDDHWSVGGDIRYAHIDSTVKIDGQKMGTVDVNPFVYSLTVGYRF